MPHEVPGICLRAINPFGTAVSFRGQTGDTLLGVKSCMHVSGQCSTRRVDTRPATNKGIRSPHARHIDHVQIDHLQIDHLHSSTDIQSTDIQSTDR